MLLNKKTLQVFEISTFSDLVKERNALQKNVFPKLPKLYLDHDFRFQVICLTMILLLTSFLKKLTWITGHIKQFTTLNHLNIYSHS